MSELIKAGNWADVTEYLGWFHVTTYKGPKILVTKSKDKAVKTWKDYEERQEVERGC